MSLLPSRRRQDPPPAVEHLRRTLRDSRVGRVVARRRTLAAAVVGLLAVLKVGRWALVELAWAARHPGEAIGWVADHWIPVAAVGGVVFAVAFVSARLGIRWLSDDTDDDPSTLEVGPAWAQRPPDRGMDHVPRAG